LRERVALRLLHFSNCCLAAQYYTPFDLRAFPFDSQSLRIQMEIPQVSQTPPCTVCCIALEHCHIARTARVAHRSSSILRHFDRFVPAGPAVTVVYGPA